MLPAKRRPVIDLVPTDRTREKAMRAHKIHQGMNRRYETGKAIGVGIMWLMWTVLHLGALLRGDAITFTPSWWAVGFGVLITGQAVGAWWVNRRRHREYLKELGIDP